MEPARQDFYISSNADFSEEITLAVAGVGFSVAGHSFKMDFKSAPSTAPIFTLQTVATTVEGIYPVEPENGYIQIRINKNTLNNAFNTLNPSVFVGSEMRLYYDLVVTLPSTNEEVWLYGYLNVSKGITNV